MRHRVPFISLAAISVPFLFGSWLVLVGTTSTSEIVLGFIAATAGGFAVALVEQGERLDFRPRVSDLMRVIYVPWLLIQGTCQIFLVALHDLFGGRKAASVFRVVPFDPGKATDPHDVARRVLTVVYTTITPPSIVLGINRRQRQLVFHQIEKSAVPRVTKELGARS